MLDFVLQLLAAFVAPQFFRRRIEEHKRKVDEELAAQGRTECGVRVTAGTVKGLSSSWIVGTWTVERGRLRLGSRIVVGVDAVRPGFRHPTVREVWDMDPDFEILALESGDAMIELSLRPQRRAWALERLELSPTEPRSPRGPIR